MMIFLKICHLLTQGLTRMVESEEAAGTCNRKLSF